jgi:hypothetical protein
VTVTDFLLERIAEDEQDARNFWDWDEQDGEGEPGTWIRWVLAECEAKRAIIAELNEVQPTWDDLTAGYGPEDWLAKRVALALAQPYADHPDFQPEWRP